MRNLNRREKILLIVIVFLAVTAGYYYLVYQPMEEEKEMLAQEITILNSSIASSLDRIVQIPELEEKLADLHRERETVLEMGYRDSEEVLARLNSFSSQSEMTLDGYQLGSASDGYPFNLSGRGNYIPVLKFIWLIDDWDYRLEMEDFTLTAEGENGELLADFDFFFHQHEDIRKYLD
ncbi:hypothetical protein [Halarsenatibacter silvermanii]|uniref:Type IV pilus assembly protein PilO n=1 Tax=Halarsenatibacter silvermanii TaxID=321763 RepID=A0A1G9LC06_9FIRM|nr:hypothetical protein [Halarsenatibacter silvermanii]SDL59498.1 type IV pilus assembly protein PilO [Halarsenatibacter silvermanii]